LTAVRLVAGLAAWLAVRNPDPARKNNNTSAFVDKRPGVKVIRVFRGVFAVLEKVIGHTIVALAYRDISYKLSIDIYIIII
jgi:hypothetical protein